MLTVGSLKSLREFSDCPYFSQRLSSTGLASSIDSVDYDGDRRKVLERALSQGVGIIIAVGSDLSSSRKSIDIANTFDDYALYRVDVIAKWLHSNPEDLARFKEPNNQRSWQPILIRQLREIQTAKIALPKYAHVSRKTAHVSRKL